MSYASPLETRLAKKVTKAISDYQLIEDGDRVMVGLSGGKDSWAMMQILDVLRTRALTVPHTIVPAREGPPNHQEQSRRATLAHRCIG